MLYKSPDDKCRDADQKRLHATPLKFTASILQVTKKEIPVNNRDLIFFL